MGFTTLRCLGTFPTCQRVFGKRFTSFVEKMFQSRTNRMAFQQRDSSEWARWRTMLLMSALALRMSVSRFRKNASEGTQESQPMPGRVALHVRLNPDSRQNQHGSCLKLPSSLARLLHQVQSQGSGESSHI